MSGATRFRLRPYLLLAPLSLLLLLGVLAPMCVFVLYAFWRKAGFDIVPDFTLANFMLLWHRDVYLGLIGKAIVYGVAVAAITLLLAYPLAYIVATRVKSAKNLVLLAVLVPLYTSDIVRIFAWRSVLGINGLINQSLMALGLRDQPIEALLFTPFAALISLVHMMFPFMFLAVWAGLESLRKPLIEAAKDLGAGPGTVFVRVILPLSLPGVLAGFFFVFVPVTGDYVYTNMMGGPGGTTIAKAIVQQFGAANNWPFGSALATATMLAMLVFLVALGAAVARLPSIRMYGHGRRG